MGRRGTFMCTGIAIGVALAVIVGAVMPASAQDCRLIRIQGMAVQKTIRVEPETLLVSKGTCVIWLNRASAEEVKVVFEDGKECASVSDSPTGFSLNHQQCYVTSWIPFGGTSSLRFNEAGSYEYVMEIKSVKQKKVKGIIIVE